MSLVADSGATYLMNLNSDKRRDILTKIIENATDNDLNIIRKNPKISGSTYDTIVGNSVHVKIDKIGGVCNFEHV